MLHCSKHCSVKADAIGTCSPAYMIHRDLQKSNWHVTAMSMQHCCLCVMHLSCNLVVIKATHLLARKWLGAAGQQDCQYQM